MRKILWMMMAVVPLLLHAEESAQKQKIQMVSEVEACRARNDSNAKECRNQRKNLLALEQLYGAGDKSLLRTLLRDHATRTFLGDALLGDPIGFMSELGEFDFEQQREICVELAGRIGGLRSRERFEELRQVLRSTAFAASSQAAARLCLRQLEISNAIYLADYLPANTFTGGAADLDMRFVAEAMFALDEQPLWQHPEATVNTYRLTIMPAPGGLSLVRITVPAHGQAQLVYKRLDWDSTGRHHEGSSLITDAQLQEFQGLLVQANFWSSPAELRSGGFDGEEWLLEVVENGRYHAVMRWSPCHDRQNQDEIRFGEAALQLLHLAGETKRNDCSRGY